MAVRLKYLQYTLAFISGILAYLAAGFARAALEPYLVFPSPPPDFLGPAYLWRAYYVIGLISVYYWLIFYGALFCVLCLGLQKLTASKLSVRRILATAATITILVTITVYSGIALEMALDPKYRNPPARNILDAVTFALIGGWFVMGWYLVQRRQRADHQ